MTNLEAWIKKCEALRLHPYLDTAEPPKITIAWGRNLTDNGLSEDEAEYLFQNDFKRCQNDLNKHQWYLMQPQNVKDALMNMCFNLGINRLSGFKRMISALEAKNYTVAAMEALDSKWAMQVGQRAKDVALLIRQGDKN